MRTTITISEDLLSQAMKLSGKKAYSEAIITSLHDYVNLRSRLNFLNKLYETKLPHSFKTIKKIRKKGTWSL